MGAGISRIVCKTAWLGGAIINQAPEFVACNSLSNLFVSPNAPEDFSLI